MTWDGHAATHASLERRLFSAVVLFLWISRILGGFTGLRRRLCSVRRWIERVGQRNLVRCISVGYQVQARLDQSISMGRTGINGDRVTLITKIEEFSVDPPVLA